MVPAGRVERSALESGRAGELGDLERMMLLLVVHPYDEDLFAYTNLGLPQRPASRNNMCGSGENQRHQRI